MSRATHLERHKLRELDWACHRINLALETTCYLMGSCLRTPNYRDVDVRAMVEAGRFSEELRQLLSVLISDWLSSRSRLPVDFQIQNQAEANEKYGSGRRIALGLVALKPGQ